MRVKYFPCQPHCFAFGGFDIQMINTLNAVKKAGVDASKLDIWSRDNDFEIIHLWGVGPHNFQIIDWSKKSGKAIIATVLMPYHDTLRSKLGYLSRLFNVRHLIHYFKLIDKIVVVNNLQRDVLNNFYAVPVSKIEIIPHLVEDKFFEIPDFNFSEKYGIENYILCTGNISSRKNQYNLALACINLNLKLVLIGSILDGEMGYGEKLETLAARHKNILWIKELPKASEELISAYYHCKIYALPSKSETQPIGALEAVAMRKPLVLLNRKYAYQGFYNGAFLCKSPSVGNIESALTQVLNNKSIPQENKEIINCREDKIGNAYKECYKKLG